MHAADAPSLLQVLLGLLGFLLPLALYATWSTLALWDLGRRDDAGAGATWGWSFAIFALPFVGALAYLFAGGGHLAPRLRTAAVGGGIATYALVLALGAAAGGIA